MAAATETRSILHVDMDAFFASVEALESPELRNRPLIVGGDGPRGVVASCSYEARFYGVRSAMPSARARRLCPQAVFVAGRFHLYESYSRRMHDVFESFTPLVEGLSLDEAFLDVTGAQKLFGSAVDIAWSIRERIESELGLSASVGVADTKHVAKLASVAAKPKASPQGPIGGAGVVVVDPADALPFLHRLPVRALWGVGPKSAERLEKIGVTTVRQLAAVPLPDLAAAVGSAAARQLHDLAWNRDGRDVEPDREPKSVGHEQTFPVDLRRDSDVHDQLVRLADGVARRLRAGNVAGRTVTLKVRFGSFETITRSRTITEATATARSLAAVADDLVSAIDVSPGVRLLGLSVSNLEPATRGDQLRLDDRGPNDQPLLDDAVDRIRERFGDGAVMPGPLVGEHGPGILRAGERQWGPSAPDAGAEKGGQTA